MTKTPVETPEQKQYRETVEKIAGNISSLSKAVSTLLKGPLKKKALVVLLAASSQLPQSTVDRVLSSLSELEGDWLNK